MTSTDATPPPPCPKAIAEANSGKRWNHRTREWVREDLVAESVKLSEIDDEDILEKARQRARERGSAPGIEGMMGGGGGGGEAGKVSEMEFYDILEVTPTATTAEIKRSYYLMARKLHPDKNPDDPNAKDKFQKIGEAYQVLSDQELRKKYDERGKAGLGEHSAVDASAFFAVLFGSDQMEACCGSTPLDPPPPSPPRCYMSRRLNSTLVSKGAFHHRRVPGTLLSNSHK